MEKQLKVLMLNGSPREHGNIALVFQEMEQVFQENGVEFENILLGKQDIRGCIACETCRKTKKCVFEGDLCKTETKECSGYKSYEPVENCINIKPTDVDPTPSKVCRYNGSACIEDYNTCDDYKGTDKKICESINDGKHQCILEKDTTRTYKPFYCSEAKNIIECMLSGAVAENSRKKCFYYGN